jgi:hypothetical protein
VHLAQILRLSAAVLAAILYASPAPAATEGCTTGELPFACKSEAAFDRLAEMKDDLDAFKKAMMLYVAAGQCTMLDPGESVFIEDKTWFSGRARVRMKGALTSYWVMAEEISDKPCADAAPAASSAPHERAIPLSPTAPAAHYPSGVSSTNPVLHAGTEKPRPKCEYKAVMTDADIANCRASGSP